MEQLQNIRTKVDVLRGSKEIEICRVEDGNIIKETAKVPAGVRVAVRPGPSVTVMSAEDFARLDVDENGMPKRSNRDGFGSIED